MTSEKPVALHIITGLGNGGAEAILYNLIHAANDFEHKVISLMGPGKYGPKLVSEGFDVSYVGLKPSAPSPLKLLRLRQLVRRAKPNVVQTWMYHADLLGGLAAWMSDHRAIVWGLHHTTLDANSTKWATRTLVRVNTLVSSWLPRRIITCSRKGELIHRELGYPAEKFVVVNNGYDTAIFEPDKDARTAVRSEFGIADDQLLLGCVARYNPQKDHRNLLLGFAEVVKQRTDAHLLLIGPDLTAENVELVALLSETGLGGHVTLVGPRSDISAIMNGLDLHVLSSAYGEAFPNVLSEAMSCGTPCIATDVGDAAAIVGDTGRIVPPRAPLKLADAILSITPVLGDPVIAEACRAQITEKFTLEHMVKGYQEVWHSCMLEVGKTA